MRPGFLIFVLFVVLLLAAILFLHRPTQSPIGTSQPQISGQSITSLVSLTASSTGMSPHVETIIQSPPTSSTDTNSETRRQAIIEQFIAQKNGTVDFYGKFIDQDSNALSDVNIKVSILTLSQAAPKTGEPVASTETGLERTSDADGRVEIKGETGANVRIESIQKDGYDIEQGQRNFGYLAGSFENPIVFKMWSTNIHQKLITGNYAFQIAPDGKPHFIDLTTGTINESGTGDLKVWIQYTNRFVPGQMSDWAAGIDVINGGLQAATDYAMWMAPTDGYVPSFTDAGQIRGGQRGQIGERRFYLQLQNGNEYGQMTIDLLAPFNVGIPGLIRLTYAINPSGSRILR